ncbi:hypothetical protein SAMN02910447_00793 [Ruminococcus sp. YE71]|uniref:IBR domain-containing protein n=1 Tax=unclassified Ruminococcus TaxID=2608920 RepID=UPI0008831CA6|nr:MULTISPECIES: IBR domain-containing protein [unclassified Ruminococcus]SDA14123.1 hypothetical protein SAMN02910446_00792 [Ruminococcus sp. YE78]SFW20600.1 hypothetical protein SAMN02910447_00793 [Ruminococcus sp. YE71]
MAQNYYTLLKLNVDTFVSDPAELGNRLEAMKQEWNRSNNTDIRSYVSTYYSSGVVKEAFSDPARWRSIYEQAKAETDDAVANYLMLSSGKGFLYEKEIKAIASNKDVCATADYVRRIAAAQGIEVRSDEGRSAQPKAKKASAKLADYEPESKVAFNAAMKQCEKVRCTDIYDFLRKYAELAGISTRTVFSIDTPPNLCANAAEEILSAWKSKKENDEKSAIDTICTVVKKFGVEGDKHSQVNYNKQLIYTRLKSVLDRLWQAMSKADENERILSGEAQMKLVSDLAAVIDDRDKAESILDEFCREKKIHKEMTAIADRAYCPFCSNVFEKPGGKLPDSCPICRRSFIMTCPKCGKRVNYASGDTCCGFDFKIYGKLSRMCEEASGFVNTLSFGYAELLLADVEKQWRGFPEAAPVRETLRQKKDLVGKMVGSLDGHIASREFYAAKSEYERICKAVPGYSDASLEMRIRTAVSEADKLFAQCRSETDTGRKLRLLISIKQIAADCPGVDNALGNIPPSAVTSFEIGAELNSGCVNLRWSSPDPDGTVEFEVRRKAFSRPVSSEDGEFITRTTEKGFSDKTVKEGMAYYYSVFAMRGRAKSKAAVSAEPAVIFPTLKGTPEVACDETMIEVSWKADAGKMTAEVFRSENPMIKRYGDGVKLRGCGVNGFADTGLALGQKYFYNLFFRIDLEGRNYISQPIFISGETVRRGKPVTISAKEKEGAKGRFVLTIEEGIEFAPQVQFYSSESNSIMSGTPTQVGQLTGGFGMKRLGVVPTGTGTFEFSIREGESFYVYPVTVSGSNAVIGGAVYAENFKQVAVRSMRTDGVNLNIELEEWVKGQEMMYVCWRHDGYPTEVGQQGNSKTAVNRLSYQSGGIVIPNIEQKDYYITGFVRTSGEERPVFRTVFGNRKKIDISYGFSYSGLFSKQLKITFTMSEPAPLPEMSLRTMMGAVPMFEGSGAELCVIPPVSEEKKEHVYILSGKLNKNLHGKLFLRSAADKNAYQLMLAHGESNKLTD